MRQSPSHCINIAHKQFAALLQVSGINSLLVDLRTGLKQVRSTILEPAEQQASMSAGDRQALDHMISFHQTGKATFQELEVSAHANWCLCPISLSCSVECMCPHALPQG